MINGFSPKPIVFTGLTIDQVDGVASFHSDLGATVRVIDNGAGSFSVEVTYSSTAAHPDGSQMAKIETLKAEIARSWGDHPACPACIKIIDYINALPSDELAMLTFTSLKNAAGEKEITQQVLDAVTLLSSTSIHALDTHLLFIDDDEREFEIKKKELAEARKTGQFIHPETGTAVVDFESKIIPFFVPSRRFLSFKDS